MLIAHLLKWRLEPGLRGNSWRLTIREQRRKLDRLLAQNPSLRSQLDTILVDAFGDAVLIAQRETGLEEDAFPLTCPWTFEETMTDALT